jgi:hypothetical protein
MLVNGSEIGFRNGDVDRNSLRIPVLNGDREGDGFGILRIGA